MFFVGLGLVALYCAHHYSQDLGMPEKGRKRRDSPEPESKEDKRQFKVIVVGGSSSGLTMAAKLRQAKVDYVVLEENQKCGDQWRHRPERLHLSK